jgi:anionic cell wall polymer biosynthesis LytR-Cps2A-Psr (LCP) family protein
MPKLSLNHFASFSICASKGFLMRHFIVILLLLCAFSVFAQEATEEVIPEAMPLIDEGEADIINVLLIGAATRNPNNPGLTDMLMIISLNRDTGHIALVSIPRDLYVYVPDVEMMKINQVYFSGERGDGDTGMERLYATIRYNATISASNWIIMPKWILTASRSLSIPWAALILQWIAR